MSPHTEYGPLERYREEERRDVEPPAGSEARVWAGVVQRLAHGPPPVDLGPEGSPVAAAAPGVAANVGIKVVTALLLAGALGAGGWWAAAGRSRGPIATGGDRAVAPAGVGGPTGASSTMSGEGRPSPAETVPEGPADDAAASEASFPDRPLPRRTEEEAAPATGRRAETGARRTGRGGGVTGSRTPRIDSGLAAELRLVRRISAALRDGRAQEALRLADHHRRRFPDGRFVEERTALEARALCRSGRGTEGRRLARRFARKHPDSIHLPVVRAECHI